MEDKIMTKQGGSQYVEYIELALINMHKGNYNIALVFFAKAREEEQQPHRVTKKESKQLMYDCLNSI